MFNNLSRREKIVIVLGITILLISLYYFNLYQPLLNKVEKLEMEIKQKESNLKVLEKIEKQLPIRKKKYQQLKERVNNNSNASISSFTDLLQKFNQMEDEYGVKLVSFKPKKLEETIKMDITYHSQYDKLIDLFDNFNKYDNRFVFKNLNLKQRNKTLQANIKVIYLKGGKYNDE
jgi:Tfp pilus assembly protein PilO